MKFLLKQQLNIKKEETIIHIIPNKFSSELIKLAKKKDLIFDINKAWNGNYSTIKSYEILENDFNRLRTIIEKKIERKRQKFYNLNLQDQLILILKYIFNRNNRAKQNRKYSAILNAYSDKQEFLEIALKIAKNIDSKYFTYGWQEDPNESIHSYIYYFQFGNKQVSFHSSKLILDCPEFKGSWIGYRNESFPFKYSKIK